MLPATNCTICNEPITKEDMPEIWIGNGGIYCKLCGSIIRNQKRNPDQTEGGQNEQ